MVNDIDFGSQHAFASFQQNTGGDADPSDYVCCGGYHARANSI